MLFFWGVRVGSLCMHAMLRRRGHLLTRPTPPIKRMEAVFPYTDFYGKKKAAILAAFFSILKMLLFLNKRCLHFLLELLTDFSAMCNGLIEVVRE